MKDQSKTVLELNPLALTHNGVEVRHVRKNSDDASSRVTAYWFMIHGQEVDARTLAGYKEPVYNPNAEPGDNLRAIAAETRRVLCLAIDKFPPLVTTPAVPTIPLSAQVETLLTFIGANASDEVFEKAQELETVLSLNLQGVESDLKDSRTELADLKEELTDGHALASYAAELTTDALADFAYSLLDGYTVRAAIKEELKDELFKDGTTYLAVPTTLDTMDEIAVDELARVISKLGIAEALRLLTAC